MPHSASNPLVSVIMPAFNHEAYVRAAVESVLNQTYTHLELIIIDDASSDGTWEVLQSIDDVQIRRYRHETNLGAHATLNEAMQLAGGEFISIINSDDVYAKGRIERLVGALALSRGESEMVFTDVEFVGPSGITATGHPREVEYHKLCLMCEKWPPAVWFFAGNPAMTTSNLFFTRALQAKIGEFADLRYTHDWDWLFRALGYTQPSWIREPLLCYRVHEANTVSESDAWTHIHENSLIQSQALLHLSNLGGVSEPDAFDVCRALLANESVHPLPLLVYLVHRLIGVQQDRLQHSAGRSGSGILERLLVVSEMPVEVFQSLRSLSGMVSTADGQAALLDERWNAMQEMTGMVEERDKSINAQARLIEERASAMLEMTHMIEERDKSISSQARLIEERALAMLEMTHMIEERDKSIDSQARLIEERACTIQEMTRLAEEKEQWIAAQDKLINDRYQAMQEMSSIIAVQNEEKINMASELASLHSDRLVRLALGVRRLVRRRDNPEH